MGRTSTGAVTTGEVMRLELSYLKKHGYLKEGKTMGYLTWTSGASINITSHIGDDERYIRLTYSFKSGNHEGKQMDYNIWLTFVPSNLGRGEVPYFVCPYSGRRARILYLCYGSLKFRCRTAYPFRIYYDAQQCSKLSYHNTRYWKLEKELERCNTRSKKKHYQGKETRLGKRIGYLRERQEYHDWARWLTIPQVVLRHSPEWLALQAQSRLKLHI